MLGQSLGIPRTELGRHVCRTKLPPKYCYFGTKNGLNNAIFTGTFLGVFHHPKFTTRKSFFTARICRGGHAGLQTIACKYLWRFLLPAPTPPPRTPGFPSKIAPQAPEPLPPFTSPYPRPPIGVTQAHALATPRPKLPLRLVPVNKSGFQTLHPQNLGGEMAPLKFRGCPVYREKKNYMLLNPYRFHREIARKRRALYQANRDPNSRWDMLHAF